MKLISFSLGLLFLLIYPAVAQKPDRKLQSKLQQLLKGFGGDVGIFVKDLKRNRIAEASGDTVFPTASMIKLPILIGVMDKIERSELKLTDELIYKDSLLYPGVDLLGSFKSNEKIELSKVIMLMLTMSDNTASLWLQSLAGSGSRINWILDSLGFKSTRVNSRTPGREQYRELYGWGQTTPREMVGLLEKIYNGEIISEQTSTKMLRFLGRNYWDEVAISEVPAGIFIASKNGAVDASRSEVLLVNAPRRPYIFCICTKNNKDHSWNSNNEAWRLTKKVSAFLWEYFQ